jgi:hypothetical protein
LGVVKIHCRDVAVHSAEHRRFPFAGVIHQINEREQSEDADDDACTAGRPALWDGGLTRRVGWVGLHVNLLPANCTAQGVPRGSAIRWMALFHR